MRKFEAILFDLDGVISDSGRFHFLSWKNTLKKYGVDFTEEDFSKTFGMKNPDIIRMFIPDADGDLVRRISEEKEKEFRKIAKGRIKPIEGAVEFVRKCKSKGFKLALVSSTPTENIRFIEREFDLENVFDAVVSAEDVKKGKPDPEPYLLACRKLEIPPQNAIVIEDSQHGVDAGKRAGALTVGILTTHSSLDADIVVKNFAELEKVFQKLGIFPK